MDIQSLLSSFAAYPVLLFFLAAFIGGEELIIPLAILTGQGLWDVPTLFLTCFSATLLSDLAWFLLGRHGIHKRKFFQKYRERYRKMSVFIRKLATTELGLLLVTKFIYGTRIFTIIYISLEGLSVPRFIKLNTLVIFIWLSCIITLGWLIGRGSALFGSLYEHPALFAVGIIALLVLFHIIRGLISKKILPQELQP